MEVEIINQYELLVGMYRLAAHLTKLSPAKIRTRPHRSPSALEPIRFFAVSRSINYSATAPCQHQWSPPCLEKMLARTLKINIRVLGETHWATLASMVDLASVYHNQKRWNEAAPLDVMVMDTRLNTLGDEHPDTLSAILNFGVTSSMLGREDQARLLKIRVTEGSLKMWSEEHPFTLHAMNSLAATYRNRGEFGQAEKLGTPGDEIEVESSRRRAPGHSILNC